MNEEQKSAPRTPEQIQQEYAQLCIKAGDLGYKIQAFQKDLDMVHGQLRDLNFEYVTAVNAAKAPSEEVKS